MLFCRYIRPTMVLTRQIDLITNYSLLVLSLATNFRFSFLVFSKMFPHPKIEVPNEPNLRPLHLLLAVSSLTDLLTIVGAIFLLMGSQAYSVTYMLAIDLILLGVLMLFIVDVIVLVGVEKPIGYYSQTKKYTIQENYRTEDTLNDKEISKAKLDPNGPLRIEDFTDEGEGIDGKEMES